MIKARDNRARLCLVSEGNPGQLRGRGSGDGYNEVSGLVVEDVDTNPGQWERIQRIKPDIATGRFQSRAKIKGGNQEYNCGEGSRQALLRCIMLKDTQEVGEAGDVRWALRPGGENSEGSVWCLLKWENDWSNLKMFKLFWTENTVTKMNRTCS